MSIKLTTEIVDYRAALNNEEMKEKVQKKFLTYSQEKQKHVFEEFISSSGINLNRDLKKVNELFDNLSFLTEQEKNDWLYRKLIKQEINTKLIHYFSVINFDINWTDEQWKEFHKINESPIFFHTFMNYFHESKTPQQWLDICNKAESFKNSESVNSIIYHLFLNKTVEQWKNTIDIIENSTEEIQKKVLAITLKLKEPESVEKQEKVYYLLEKLIKNANTYTQESFLLNTLYGSALKEYFSELSQYISDKTVEKLWFKITQEPEYMEKHHKKSYENLENVTNQGYKWLIQNNPPQTLVNEILYKSLLKNRLPLINCAIDLDKENPGAFSNELFSYILLYAVRNNKKELFKKTCFHILENRKEVIPFFKENILLNLVDTTIPLLTKMIEVHIAKAEEPMKENFDEISKDVLKLILDEDMQEKKEAKKMKI